MDAAARGPAARGPNERMPRGHFGRNDHFGEVAPWGRASNPKLPAFATTGSDTKDRSSATSPSARNGCAPGIPSGPARKSLGAPTRTVTLARSLSGPVRTADTVPAVGEWFADHRAIQADRFAAAGVSMGEISDALRRSRENAPPKPDALPPVRETSTLASRPEPARKADAPRVEISELEGESWPSRVLVTDGQSASAEAARHIALRLRRELGRRNARSLAVISSERAEGKTTVACNLALALASLSRGRVVALVDLDLRAPSIAAALGIPQARGIDDVLRGSCQLDDVRVEIERPGLDVYPARAPEANAHELLVSGAFAALVGELERRYEMIVFDTPPTLLVPDAPVIIEQVGAAVAVSRAGRTRRNAFKKMLELLPPAKLIGTILNEGLLPGAERQYGYYGVPRPE